MKYLMPTAPSGQRQRQRKQPQDRKAELLCAYIALVIGDHESPNNIHKPAHYLTMAHTDIGALADVSTATVFNYFPDVADLHNDLNSWAFDALYSHDQETRRAAEIVVKQILGANPMIGEARGLHLVLETDDEGLGEVA